MRNRRDWHKFDRVHVQLEPEILRIIDYVEGIVWINTHPAPGANVIHLRQ